MKNIYVTILILIDGFLQYEYNSFNKAGLSGHNPYFNRWFSAIDKKAFKRFLRKKSQSLF